MIDNQPQPGLTPAQAAVVIEELKNQRNNAFDQLVEANSNLQIARATQAALINQLEAAQARIRELEPPPEEPQPENPAP